ncbi:hypothetical protein [Streptomyces sp. S.PNR 29]|uniref:hypothetical protein n=1 Tax=Streptomyces sp. S.PNR 29 TaxID=2973805 RepID=UPI0025AF79D9|nr:hypothetical protein [Streptomyces sp. S.PNR 29]MDN0201051.1 hypothetical protein [Streptomyces sp. S.PNR 29]
MPRNTRRHFSRQACASCLAAALALPVGAASTVAALQGTAQARTAAPAQPTPTPPEPETPTEESPAPETPTQETPTEESPAPETPTQETPTEETPTEESPTEETPTEETPTEETPTEETPTEESPTEETPTEETPTEETPTETEETPTEPGKTPQPTTPAEAKDEAEELSRDPDTPAAVKSDLAQVSTLLDEAQNKPPEVKQAAVDVSVSVFVAVDALKNPATSAPDKKAISNCVNELTASIQVIVDVKVSAKVRQALVKVSVDVKVSVQALTQPKLPPKTKTAIRGCVREGTATLKTIRSAGTSQKKKTQLSNLTAPIQIVTKIIVNTKTTAGARNTATTVLVQLRVVVTTFRENDKPPTAQWKSCNKALSDLSPQQYTNVPQQCEGSLTA